AVEGAGSLAADLDKGGGLRVGPGADRVLMVVEHGERDAAVALQGVDKGGNRPVADPLDMPLNAVDRDRRGDAPLAGARLGQQAVIDEANAVAAEIGVLKQGP